jgi:hypothetical protein
MAQMAHRDGVLILAMGSFRRIRPEARFRSSIRHAGFMATLFGDRRLKALPGHSGR